METDVELADSIIYSMQEPTCKRQRALYALLKTQIDYKMYRDIPNDSIIRIATDYYGTKYKDYHAAMAWYSLGCVSGINGQDSTAADAYLTSIRLFPDTLVRYYALAEQNLSCIYIDHKMDAEAYPMIKACYKNAIHLKDSAILAFCEFNIARYLLYNNDYDSARTMFLNIKDNKWMTSSMKAVPYYELSVIAFCQNNFLQSISYADSFIVMTQHQLPYGSVYSTKADAYYFLGQIDSAFYYYRLSLTDSNDPYTICNTYRYLAEIYSSKGEQDSATYCTKQVSMWADSIVTASNSEIILRALLNHSNSLVPKKDYKYTLLLIISIFTVIIVIILLYLHSKTKKEKIEETLETIESRPLRTSIYEFTDDINEFKHGKLYKTMATNITKQEEPTQKDKNALIKDFRDSLIELRTFISTSGKVNPDDIDFCIFTMLGFGQKDFNILFNIGQSRTLKYRLKSKLPEELFNYIFNTYNIIRNTNN
ncbi:MAG: hypothetical protein MJY68_07050 [Bacteroidaceae bacterium]|nr:hypothetical protein [Bacteroidaceae bacterium]